MLETFSEFHFLRPWWLLLIGAVPLLVGMQLRLAMRSNNWHRVIAPSLFDALIESKSTHRMRAIMALPAIALLCAAIGLAGPTYERLPQPVETKQDPLVIVLDLTLSMTSSDLQPTRAERAKFKISDILERREEGLTGLVVYAGDAYVVTPLTRDDDTILNLLPSLAPDMMPVNGSNAVAALRLANQMLDSVGHEAGRVLLLTDGIEDFARLRNEIDTAYPISILGVGLAASATNAGQRELFAESRLRDFAMVAGGRYRTLATGDADISYLLAERVLTPTELLENQSFDAWHDMGYYLILPIALLLAFAMRRGGIAVILLVIGSHVHGGWLQDLWVPQDSQAYAAHEQGDFKGAAEKFNDPQWRGVAKYRSGEFAEAGELFARNEATAAKYNEGNALAWSGKLNDAIEAYDRVLVDDPDHEDAKHNKAVLEKLLEDLQNQQQQGGDSEESQQSDQQNSQDQSAGDQQEQPSQENQADSSEGQQEQQQANAEPEEQESESEAEQQVQQPDESEQVEDEGNQSMAEANESAEDREMREIHERWLRRIPNDPSGLLRRKFQAESNARIERGELDRNEVGPAW